MAEELEQDLAAENVGGEADQTIQADGALADTPAAEEAAAPVNENFKWYIIHAYSGFERKVKESLMSRVAAYFELVDITLGRGVDKILLHLTKH